MVFIQLNVFCKAVFFKFNLKLCFILQSESLSSSICTDEEVKSPKKLPVYDSFASKNPRSKPKDSEYFVAPDNYFMMNSSKKVYYNHFKKN